jgi:spectinomycin phosphotransferase
VRDRPRGVSEPELRVALADGWHIDVAALRYVPEGGGGYHWAVRDGRGGQWFATVDDLDDKPWLGDDRATVSEGLHAAMETAIALRRDAGLGFVLAPSPARDGAALRALDSRHTLSVFPFVHGATGRFGDEPAPARQARLVEMLAALHLATPAADRARRLPAGVPYRGALEEALGELDTPWHGGPFSEPARALIAGAADWIGHLLDTFDRLAARVAALEPVITHGEPHPGNVIRTEADTLLIDWDTVGLAPPERDLWWVLTDDSDQACRYAEATGRPADPAGLALYRIRWALDDLSVFTRRFRSPHDRAPETEHSLRTMTGFLTEPPRHWPRRERAP